MTDSIFPSESEQNEAREYVCKRELVRPDVHINRIAWYTLIFIFAVALCTFITSLFIKNFHIVFIVLGYTLVGLMLLLKKIIILLVHIYQHYAPEDIRRKCIFKPTCSEYMILALEKYGLVKGLYKGIYRVFIKCGGFYYSIDYP